MNSNLGKYIFKISREKYDVHFSDWESRWRAGPALVNEQIVCLEVSMNETNLVQTFQHVQHFNGIENA